jgi:hypothetical protein
MRIIRIECCGFQCPYCVSEGEAWQRMSTMGSGFVCTKYDKMLDIIGDGFPEFCKLENDEQNTKEKDKEQTKA